MSVEVVLDSPLAQALNSAIQPKLVEVGWSTGGADDSALSEYIILMLVNGKTQDQIAAELSGDLLNLGPDDPGARDFSQWLFQQVDVLNSQQNGGDGGLLVADSGSAQEHSANGGQDADMGDVSDSGDTNVYAISSVDLSQDLTSPIRSCKLMYSRPTGPKSMRNGGGNRPRDKRMLGHLAKAMDRTSDSVLHRVRPQNGNERINSHSRGPPTGPRQQVPGRGAPRMPNGRLSGGMGGMPMAGTAAANVMNMNPQQQLELYAMLEQQSRLMAQMLGPQQQQQMGMGRGGTMVGNGPMGGYAQQQSGRSLFDRVQANPQRPQHNAFRKNPQNNRFGEQQQQPHSEGPSSSMDVEMSQEKADSLSPDAICKFNLSCTNPDCKFAHQSPAAPPGTTIDVTDVCSFGAACKNRKCVGRHPSPAKKIAHQIEMDCKYFPNCTNPRCPFRHPSMPLCRNGADCTTPNCKFTHVKTMCKFNPCMNPTCTFKHVEGQKRGKYEDKVWVADGAKEHVSERKFVDEDGAEELIRPGVSEAGLGQESSNTAELIT
jgi:nuclear polyadenylated RNA-binding protein NAB2